MTDTPTLKFATGWMRPNGETILRHAGSIPADEYPIYYQNYRQQIYDVARTVGFKAAYVFHEIWNEAPGEGWHQELRYNWRGQLVFDSGKEFSGPMKIVLHRGGNDD